jgi:hypothetical protein
MFSVYRVIFALELTRTLLQYNKQVQPIKTHLPEKDVKRPLPQSCHRPPLPATTNSSLIPQLLQIPCQLNGSQVSLSRLFHLSLPSRIKSTISIVEILALMVGTSNGEAAIFSGVKARQICAHLFPGSEPSLNFLQRLLSSEFTL